MNPSSISTALPTTVTVNTTTTAAASAASTTDIGGDTLQLHMSGELRPVSQSQPQTEALIQPHQDLVVAAQAISAPSETAILPIQNPPPQSSKLPLFRPSKIRKLSPDTPVNADSRLSEPATTSMALATVPDPNKSTASAKNGKNKLIVSQNRPQTAVPRAVVRSLSCDGEIEIALRHLRSADPDLARLIDLHQPPTFDSFQTPFLALSKSILYQQLAYKAGTSICARFVALCGGEEGVVPETVLALTPQQLRQIGVSGRKASYLHDLARKYQNGILSDSAIINMDDKSLFTMLTMVNGIGSWSVHMFMISSLHRPDVLPVNDLGVRKGVQLLYGLEELPRPSQMDQLCEKWRPYRSVASWYLWRFVEAKGAPSSAAAVSAQAMSLQQQQQEQQVQLQHHQHQQPPPPFLDCSGIINLGACAWGQ
ncbi:hypothetical protein Ancab_028937 [Ancistrocladus abbreviatus]